MIDHINYSGITTNPPDNCSPDGQLSISENLVYEDGSLRPIMPPTTLFTLASGRRVVFIHTHGSFGSRHYFIFDDTTQKLMWQDGESATPTMLSDSATFPGFRDMTAVGNIIIINFSKGIGYARWKEGHYLYLGTDIPDICIQFGLNLHYAYTQQTTHSIVGEDGVRNETTGSSIPRWNNKSIQEGAFTAVLGDLLMVAKEKIMSKGMFYQPFMVRYALRLFDGSYVYHSAPVPMIPSYVIPTSQISNKKNVDSTIFEFQSLTYLRAFLLQYCIIDFDDVEMAKWEDIIAGVDIFVSAPIYTFDQSKAATRPGNMDAAEAFRTILGLEASNPSRAYNQEEITGGNSSGSNWRPPGGTTIVLGASTYAGTYDGHEHYFSGDELYTGSMSTDWYPFEPNYNFFADLRNCSEFYLLSSIEAKDLKKMSAPQCVPIEHSNLDLTNLVTRIKLTDDYQTRCHISPAKVHSYNSRLNACNVNLTLPNPFPIRSMTPYLEANIGEEFGGSVSLARFSVLLTKDGVEYEVINNIPAPNAATLSPYAFFFTRRSFPRWLFYPDASARRMRLELYNNNGTILERYDIPLTPHNTLNGAYYFRGMIDERPGLLDADVVFQNRNLVHYPNKIYTFETNNPFFFEPNGINTVGNGEVISICPAVRALSQGQFGQFPMYAFSTEGVWALQVDEIGLYSTRQPVLRDVCIYPESITQLDRSVAFATERGIMVLSGADVTCISSALDADEPFSVADLDTERYGAAYRVRPTFTPFKDILSTARMAFDYTNQRLFVYSPEKGTQYVYSLKTQQWGMASSRVLMSSVNSYPDAFVMGQAIGGIPALLDVAHTSASSVQFSIITRPLKLGYPDTMKTFRYLVLRGTLRPDSNLKQLIHASRDLFNWALVAGSRNLFLRRVSGTPYKYFRVELFGDIAADESISGFDAEFIPRFTNRLR